MTRSAKQKLKGFIEYQQGKRQKDNDTHGHSRATSRSKEPGFHLQFADYNENMMTARSSIESYKLCRLHARVRLELACWARRRLPYGPYLVSRRAGAEEEGRREVAAPEPGDGGEEEGKEEEEEETRHDGG